MWYALYRQHDQDEVRTYGRVFYGEGLEPRFRARVRLLMDLGMAPGDRVLVVGCAYGFLIEALLDEGIDAYGIDSSPYVHDHLREQARPDVAGRIVRGTPGPELGSYDWVVDEDAANSQTDDELAGFHAALEACAPSKARVVHMVSCGAYGDSAVNWKDLEGWRATAPDHHWFDAREVSY